MDDLLTYHVFFSKADVFFATCAFCFLAHIYFKTYRQVEKEDKAEREQWENEIRDQQQELLDIDKDIENSANQLLTDRDSVTTNSGNQREMTRG